MRNAQHERILFIVKLCRLLILLVSSSCSAKVATLITATFCLHRRSQRLNGIQLSGFVVNNDALLRFIA